MLDSAVGDDVGVEVVQVESVGIHRLFEIEAQTAHLRVFAGVDLNQQQLEQRFVGRLDGLVQLPEARAEVLARRDAGETAKIQYFVAAHETLV